MSNQQESGFGARLRYAKDMLQSLIQLNKYQPQQSELSISELDKLIQKAEDANLQTTQALSKDEALVTQRQSAYKTDEFSLLKRLSLISKSASIQYGNQSKELERVQAAVRQVRSVRLKSKNSPKDAAIEEENKVSTYHTSYGSQYESFEKLIVCLENLPNYDSPIQEAKISSLKDLKDLLNKLDNQLAAAHQSLSNARNERNDLFKELNIRFTKAKQFVRVVYGQTSNEYKAIKDFKI